MWHYVFTLDNIFFEGCNIWGRRGRGGDYIWHYIFTPDNIWEGVIILWHYIFTPNNIWGGGDYIVTLYFHSRQYLGKGWLYRGIIFSLPTIFGEGVIISWRYIFTPDNIWGGGDYIVTLYFHSWRYFMRGVIISWHYIFTPDNIWGGGDYIVTLYFRSPRIWHWGWLYLNIFFPDIWLQGEEDTKLFYYICSYSTHRTYT